MIQFPGVQVGDGARAHNVGWSHHGKQLWSCQCCKISLQIITTITTTAVGVERDHILERCCRTVAVGCHST